MDKVVRQRSKRVQRKGSSSRLLMIFTIVTVLSMCIVFALNDSNNTVADPSSEIWITEQPVNDYIDNYSNAVFTVDAVGSDTSVTDITYIWQDNSSGSFQDVSTTTVSKDPKMLMVSPSDYSVGTLFRCVVKGISGGLPLEAITDEVTFGTYPAMHYVKNADDLQNIGNPNYNGENWGLNHIYIQTADIVFPVLGQQSGNIRAFLVNANVAGVEIMFQESDGTSWTFFNPSIVSYSFGKEAGVAYSPASLTISSVNSGFTSGVMTAGFYIEYSGNVYAATLEITMDTSTVGGAAVKAGGNFAPIGLMNPFTGVYDGRGHVIEGLNVVRSSPEAAGLFSVVEGAVLQNIHLKNGISASSSSNVGGILGYTTNSKFIRNSTNSNFVHGYNSPNVGGIIGYVTNNVIENCYNTGVVSSNNTSSTLGTSIGGIVGGVLNSTFRNCYNAGVVSANNSGSEPTYVGGVAGYSHAEVEGCYNVGTISANSDNGAIYAGGIAGCLTGHVVNCYNTGDVMASGINVSARIGAGGISGFSGAVENSYNMGRISATITNGTNAEAYAGGIMGISGSGDINNCYNAGNILSDITNSTGGAVDAGGIGGNISNSSIFNCYNTGAVSTHYLDTSLASNAGGIVGYLFGGDAVDCYNVGGVSIDNVGGHGRAGGVAGYMYGMMKNCYNAGNVSVIAPTDRIGGLIGYYQYSVDPFESYFLDTSVTGSTYIHGVSKTEGELRTIDTIPGMTWDFVAIWKENSTELGINNGFPTLRGGSAKIVQHPADRNVEQGSSATFIVIVTGKWLTYQWYESINNGTSWVPLTNETLSMLTINNVLLTYSGNMYKCEVTDSDGNTVESHAAVLTVSQMNMIITKTNMTGAGVGTGGFIYPGREVNIVHEDPAVFYVIPRGWANYSLISLTWDGIELLGATTPGITLTRNSDETYVLVIDSVEANHTLIATFSEAFLVIVAIDSVGSGKVEYEISGGGGSGTLLTNGLIVVPNGRTVLLTALALPGTPVNVFVSWTGDKYSLYNEITLSGTADVTATFSTTVLTRELKLNLDTGKAEVSYDLFLTEFTGNNAIINIPIGKDVIVESTGAPAGTTFAYWYGSENHNAAEFEIISMNVSKEYTARYVTSEKVTINFVSSPAGAAFFFRAAPTEGDLPTDYSRIKGSSITVGKYDVLYISTEETFIDASILYTFSRWIEGTDDVTNLRQYHMSDLSTESATRTFTAIFASDPIVITFVSDPISIPGLEFKYKSSGSSNYATVLGNSMTFDTSETIGISVSGFSPYDFIIWQDSSDTVIGTDPDSIVDLSVYTGTETFKATFASESYALRIESGIGGFAVLEYGTVTVTVAEGTSLDIRVPAGITIDLTAVPKDLTYTFVEWTGTTESTNPNGILNITMIRNEDVVASFFDAALTYKLFADINPTGTGTFTLTRDGTLKIYNDGMNIPAGSVVVLTAYAEQGYRFVEWRGTSASADPSGVLTIVMGKNENVTANFIEKEILRVYTITSSSDANSSITPQGKTIVSYGNDITYYFEADSNYKISRVVIDGEEHPELVSLGEYTFRHVNMNHSIVVYSTHSEGLISMTVNIDGDGLVEYTIGSVTTVTHGGTFYFERGTDVSLKAFASENSHFVVWKTGSSRYTNVEVEFDNIRASMIVTAEFDEDSESDLGWLWWLLLVIAAIVIIWFIFFYRRSYEVIKVEAQGLTIEGKDRARRNKPYKFTVIGAARGIEYLIGEEGVAKPLFSNADNEYVVPKGEVNDKLTIRAVK